MRTVVAATSRRDRARAASTAGQYNLNLDLADRSRPIPLPPLDEQRRIVARIEERLSAIDALRAAIERAQRRSASLRRAVLERAFRGELVPQDPTDEPAEHLLARIRAERAADWSDDVTDVADPNREPRLDPGSWARLAGERLDLEALATAFADTSAVRVQLFDGRYYLRIEDFDDAGETGHVEARANEVLLVINGASRVEHGDSREVRVDVSARVTETGGSISSRT